MSRDEEEKTVIATLRDRAPVKPKAEDNPPSFIQYTGEKIGKRYLLHTERMTIGRGAQMDLCIADASVSRHHADVTLQGTQVILSDPGSANGTYVNEKRLTTPTLLQDQDMVRIGTVILKYMSADNLDGWVHDKMHRLSTLDGGTGIYNKQFLLDALDAEWKKAKSTHELILLYYDLDHFKKVNDTYGHNAGDIVLRETVTFIRPLLNKTQLFCRFGGEEFVILLPQTTVETARKLGESIRATVAASDIKVQKDGATIVLRQTLSMGIAQMEAHMTSPRELLEAADKKLYTAKQSGRNRVEG
jgi:two-component system cell cycle response regulator